MFIYLNESGNLTKSNGKYFIVASYSINDPKRVSNGFRRFQKNKFPKKLRSQTEIKFNDSHIDDDLRLRTLKHFVAQDIRIFYTFLNKKNVPEEYHKKGKIHKTGQLYSEIVVATLDLYLPITEKSFIITRDQRVLKGVTISQFNEALKTSLLPKLPAKTFFLIHTVDSAGSPQVQITDWICGALARYHEQKPMGNEFLQCAKKLYCSGKRIIFRLLDEEMGIKTNKKGAAVLLSNTPRLKSSVPLGNI